MVDCAQLYACLRHAILKHGSLGRAWCGSNFLTVSLLACFVPQICLPDWPWWNRHPLEWLEVQEEEVKKVKKEKKPNKEEKAKAKAS